MLQQDGKSRVEADTRANLEEHLNAKTVEELKKELDMMFEREESEGIEADPKVVLEYYEAIEKKGQNKQTQYPGSFEESWATFTKNHPDLFPKEERKPRAPRFQLRHIIEAAVLAAILLAVSAAATDWPDYFVTWGKGILNIEPAMGVMELSEPSVDGYISLEEAVIDICGEGTSVPKWIPEKCIIKSIIVQRILDRTMITAIYESEEQQIAVRVTYYQDKAELSNIALEETEEDENATIYSKNGIDHLFISNFDRLHAVWKNGNCLYNISGVTSVGDLERMVNSSYGG